MRLFDEGVVISIHAPLAGSDLGIDNSTTEKKISIHAPLAGSDANAPKWATKAHYFNPRSPCGERLVTKNPVTDIIAFQSTLPLRGATAAPA